MELDLRDRVVVVTGAARGIGAVIAARFAGEGARVVALDLAFTTGQAADGPAVEQVVCDVTDPDSVQAAVETVVESHGTIDVLVNNAGIVADSTVVETDWTTWQRCFDVNVGGTFLMCRAVAPHMQQAGRGRILNAASKAAVVQLTRVLASELGPHDITVNAYAPGMVPTSMNGFADMPAAQQDRLLDTLSLRRWESPDDVADLLIFLASDQAAYITGTLVDVSGGKLATQIPAKAHGR